MKKYVIAFALLAGFSAQGAYRQVIPKVGQFARSKVTVAALTQIHKTLPVAAVNKSPLIGAANVLNGTTAYHLQQPDNKLHQSFFNKLPNEPVRFTVAPGNIATGLTPAMLGELLKLHSTGDLYKKEFLETSLYENWFASYKKLQPTKDKRYFKDQVNKLLRLMQAEKDQEKVQELLLSAVYFQGNTQQDLEDFLQQAGIVTAPDTQGSSLMKQYAQAFFSLTVSKQNCDFLQAEEIHELRGFCTEKALWSFLNMLFFDPETNRLSSELLSKDAQKSMLPALKEFIDKHADVKGPQYYKTAHADFLKLVHGIQGVRYLRGAVEIPGERCETLKILNHLFGTEAKTFTEFGDWLNRGNGSFRIEEPIEKEYGSLRVTAATKNLAGEWNFSSGHVYFLFDKKDSKNMSVKELQQLEEQTGTFGKLVKFVPGYVHHIIDWAKDTVDQVSEKLDKYKVTDAELKLLSRGLAETQCTVLHTAIQLAKKRSDLVEYFLHRGCDPNLADSNGDVPLKIAFRLKNTEALKSLLRHGADPNIKIYSGMTPLREVLLDNTLDAERKLDLVQSLLTAGAHADEAADEAYDDRSCSPLYLAISSNYEKIARLLVAHGADSNKKISSSSDTRLKKRYDSALTLMCAWGRLEDVKLCLELGADVHFNRGTERTPLIEAIRADDTSESTIVQIIQLLLAAGASVTDEATTHKTPLFFAVIRGYKEVAQLLIAHGADINQKFDHGSCLLEQMWLLYTIQDLQLCLELGADVHRSGSELMCRVMHSLCDGGRNREHEIIERIQLLLAAGVPINEPDTWGHTPLKVAMDKQLPKVQEFLKAHGGRRDFRAEVKSDIRDVVELTKELSKEVVAAFNKKWRTK